MVVEQSYWIGKERTRLYLFLNLPRPDRFARSAYDDCASSASR